MNSKTVVNLLGVVVVYLLAAGLVFALPPSALGPTGDQDQQVFLEAFRHNALILLGVSFGCAALWFILAEWVISAWAEHRTWLLTWFALLLVVLADAIYTAWLGPRPGPSDPANHSIPAYYVAGGLLTFYLASLLFSPTNAKYVIWPASRVRRW